MTPARITALEGRDATLSLSLALCLFLLALPVSNGFILADHGSTTSCRKCHPLPRCALSQSAEQLQTLLQTELDGSRQDPSPILLPCCYDGITARLIQQAGFEASFMTGFGVSASFGFPDTQLVSFAEMKQACSVVCNSLSIPCIVDGDTGYGNALNVKRTVREYGQAGAAGVMIEDQIAPKRCGHVQGKAVVDRRTALARIRAAADARDESNNGPLILARTDALKELGMDEALSRCLGFLDAGADMTFLEAPTTVQEMKRYCETVPGPKLANMLEFGSTPILPPSQLKEMGYTMAAYPLTLLSASIKVMQESLRRIREGESTDDLICDFASTKEAVGFTWYSQEEERYRLD